MKQKNLKKKMSCKNKHNGGGCGCGSSETPLFDGGTCSSCNAQLQSGGGGFAIPSTSVFPTSNATYYSQNSFQNDPTMLGSSGRIEGVPVNNALNIKGGNDIIVGGKKKRKSSKKTKKTKKSKKTRKSKKTKKQ